MLVEGDLSRSDKAPALDPGSRHLHSLIMTRKDEPVAELDSLSTERQALAKLVSEGVVEWQGGKPRGLRGVVVRGEPVSETIVRERQ